MPLTLEDIQDFTVEVKALIDAGLPLESHLAEAGAAHGKQLQQLTESISKGLAAGQSLEETVLAQKNGAPRILAAAVAAGVRNGRLAETVEMMGDMAEDLVDLRGRVLQAVFYPLTVVGMALLLFFVFIRGFLGQIHELLGESAVDSSSILKRVIEWDMAWWWWPLIFPVLATLLLFFWVLSGRASSMAFQGPERLLFLLPGVGGMIRDLRFYNLSRMLSLMVDRQVPLPEALLLSGACSGDESLNVAAQNAVALVESGDLSLSSLPQNWQPGMLPPLLLTCLRQTGHRESQLRERLRTVAAYYRRRLHISVLWQRNIVPVALLVIIGGGSVALYAMTVIWPVAEIYRSLSVN